MVSYDYLFNNAIVLDLETSCRDTNAKRFSANPHYPGNEILMMGTSYLSVSDNFDSCIKRSIAGILESLSKIFLDNLAKEEVLIVGHNIKFDLAHVFCTLQCADSENLHRLYVWDTMAMHYYLSGQKSTMISLENLAEYHGIEFVKDKQITEAFSAGLDITDLDPEVADQYLRQDLLITKRIASLQMSAVLSSSDPEKRFKYYLDLMQSLVTTTLMEVSGLKIDVEELKDLQRSLQSRVDSLSKELSDQMQAYLPHMDILEINPDSPLQWDKVLYGGEYKVTKPVPTGTFYKSGAEKDKPKFKKETITHTTDGMFFVASEGGRSSAEDRLKYLLASLPGDRGSKKSVLKNLLAYRGLKKELTTYVQAYMDMMHTHDNSIHANYLHTVTATKRLSSRGPNIQNISNKSASEDALEEIDG